MSEKITFGIIIPAAIFILSFLATFLIYRKFARELRKSPPGSGKEPPGSS